MQRGWFQSASLFSFFALALGLSSAARADVFDMDEFQVSLNGSTIFDDPFGQVATLAGGSGTSLSSGLTFSTIPTIGANYFVKGTITTTTANNGQAILDTSKGLVVSLPDPFVPLTSNVQAFLETGASTAHSLLPSSVFTVTGLFDLSVPATVLGTYGVAVSSQANGVAGNELEERVRETASGPVLQLEWLGFVSHSVATIADVPIISDIPGNAQLLLTMTQASNGNITATYAFGNGNQLTSFVPDAAGTVTLGSNGSATDAYSTNQFVVPGFFGFTPVASTVPEPSTWAMMLLGFAGLGYAGYRVSRKGAAFSA
jgi:hypothetical protein